MSRPQPTTPIFDPPLKRPKPTVFAAPRFWSDLRANWDGAWASDVWDTWLVVLDNSAFATSATSRMCVIDVSNPSSFTLTATVFPSGTLGAVQWINANLAVLTTNTGGQFVNLTNKASPVLGATFTTAGSPATLHYPGTGNILYVGTSTTPSFVNFTNVASPTVVNMQATAVDFDLTQRQAQVFNPATGLLYSFGIGTNGTPAANPSNIVIIDASNPAAPVKQSRLYGRALYSGVRSALLFDSTTIIADCTTYACYITVDISGTPAITGAFPYRDAFTQGGIDSRIIGRRDESIFHLEAIVNSGALLRRIDFSDLSNPQIADVFDGDYDTGSPIAWATRNCGLSGISGRGLVRGRYPVVQSPYTDRITIVNM